MGKLEFYKNIFDDELFLIDSPQTPIQKVEEPTVTYQQVESQNSVDNSIKKELSIKEIPAEEIKAPITYKGNNGKGIAIIVNYPEQEHIEPVDESFLSKVLTAVQLPSNEVCIINISKNLSLSINDLKELEIKSCLMFDVQNIFKENKKYETQSIEGISVLSCSSLKSIQQNVDEKKLLWSNLQKMFLN